MADSSAASVVAGYEARVDDWMEAERERAAGRGARRDECLQLLGWLVDELVAVTVVEAKLKAPLSQRDWEQAEALTSRVALSALVVSAASVDLHGKELRCLQSLHWLNDEVINFYLQLLEQRWQRKQSDGQQTQRAHSAARPLLIPACCAAVLSLTAAVQYPKCFYFNTSAACCRPALSLHAAAAADGSSRCCLLPCLLCDRSFFYAKLLEGGGYRHKNVARWTRKVSQTRRLPASGGAGQRSRS